MDLQNKLSVYKMFTSVEEVLKELKNAETAIELLGANIRVLRVEVCRLLDDGVVKRNGNELAQLIELDQRFLAHKREEEFNYAAQCLRRLHEECNSVAGDCADTA